jgi:hypothetical protein
MTKWYQHRIVSDQLCNSRPLRTIHAWEKHVYKDWKHRVTNICLTAVQEVKQSSERGSSSHHSLLFTPQDKVAAANAKNYIPQETKGI